MLRSLINSSSKLGNKSTSKWSGISSFVCQRANLTSDDATRVKSQFDSLSKKYKITNHELTNAIQIASINIEYLEKLLPREQFFHEKEQVIQRYAQSSFYSLGRNLQQTRSNLLKKFPELANPANYGYGEALNDLRKIFLIEGRSTTSGGARFASEYQTNADNYINALQKTHEKNREVYSQIKQLQVALQDIISNIKTNPNYYARVLTRLEGTATTSVPSKVTASNVPQKTVPSSDPDADERRLLANQYTNEIQVSHGSYLLPFTQDRKLVFEATVRHFNTIRWQLLAGALGLLTVYYLIQGDAKYKTIILVPAVAIVSGIIAKRNRVRNSYAFVKEIALHKDGHKVDVIIQLNKTFQKFENIPVSQVKLFNTDIEIPGENDRGEEEFLHTSDLRTNAGISGNLLQFGETIAFVPNDYTGNQIILRQLFKGQHISAEYL